MVEKVPPAQPEQTDDVKDLQELLQGKKEPPNEFAAYLIGQIQQAFAEGNRVVSELSAAKRRVAELEELTIQLRARGDGLVNDLRTWNRPLDNKSGEEGEAKE